MFVGGGFILASHLEREVERGQRGDKTYTEKVP